MQMLSLQEPHTSHSPAVIKTASVVIRDGNNTNSVAVSLLKATEPQSSGRSFSQHVSISYTPPPQQVPVPNILDAKCSFLIISSFRCQLEASSSFFVLLKLLHGLLQNTCW